MKQILAITRKELQTYFSSPLPLLFLGAFLAVTLFNFFTLQTFFARGVADVRPLFANLPLLLIALLAALTMRQWSEEQRSGSLEVLLTLPVELTRLVAGKFLATLAMIILALALTLPLPITVAALGPLDWGPVIGGYLAAILLAAAYAAMGLFVSSRTDNSIVALIATILLGGSFYLVGTRGVTDFIGGAWSQALWSIGAGSRFESIQRGVIDLRDLVYYLSLTGIFLTLNVLSLDSIRWSGRQKAYQRRLLFTTSLVALNLVLVNLWMYPLQGLRLDLTAGQEYTLSPASKNLLNNLQEPLLIRAYISDKTHPLLKPLEPQIRDLLREYEIVSDGKVVAEVIDPISDPAIESEANQTYGIQPNPFQVSGKYETSVINSYFDILVRYGNQTVVLGVQDLIEVTQGADGVEVRLRNLEYDLTAAIKKAVYGFQSIETVLVALNQPVQLTFFVSGASLPAEVESVGQTINQVASDIAESSNGKLTYSVVDVDSANSPVSAQTLNEQYGLQPYALDIMGQETFYFHLILTNGDQFEPIYPTAEMSDADVRTAIESAIKRTSTGFLKVVGIYTPPAIPTQDMFGQTQQPVSTYELFQEALGQDYTTRQVDLTAGVVPQDVDVLVVIAPEGLSEQAAFAIDQFLMRGGSVLVAFSNYKIIPDQFTGFIGLQPIESGLREMLAHYGVTVESGLVMDPQNMPFPVVVNRDLGGFTVQEIQSMDYPFFVDIYPDGMNTEHPALRSQPTVTLPWSSPVRVNLPEGSERTAETLLSSTKRAWLTQSTVILPDFTTYPELGFPPATDRQQYPLAVVLQGSFESYFKGKPSPLSAETANAAVIEHTTGSARLIVVGGASFVDDFVLQLASRLSQDRPMNNLQFIQNAVDWSVEDLDLLSIRSRGTFTRVLRPLETSQQTGWEVGNYLAALLALAAIYFGWRYRRLHEAPITLTPANQANPPEETAREEEQA